MENNRNFKHLTNSDYSNNLVLTKNNKEKKNKKNFKSYSDYTDLNIQNKNEAQYNNINNYQPHKRNFVIIRNSRDIMKYFPKEYSKEFENNYDSLLNDFELKYPTGNTNFYIIYDDSQKYPYKFKSSKYSNISLKSHHSFKLNVHKLMIKSNKKKYNYNIGKDFLPFCIYSKKSSNVEKNDNIKENINNNVDNRDYLVYPYRNNHFNYIRNNNKLDNSEESKNNDPIMIEDYHSFKPNINNNRNGSNNLSQDNNESKENYSNKENYTNREKYKKNENEEKEIETSEEKKNESFSTDKFSFRESDDELYNRGDLSTYGIVNILRLPKQRKKYNLKFLRRNNKENKNKNKKIDTIENEPKKEEDLKPDIKNKNNDTKIKKTEGNSFHSGKKKIKNVEFIRESLNYFYN